jgi:RNA polymerase sigma-70 factor (ECF subfamily)
MLLHHARRDAHAGPGRAEAGGGAAGFIPLAEQDRARWDYAEITQGLNLTVLAISAGRPGPFQVQAAIAAIHDTAASAAATDWRMISRWYAELARLTPRPIVVPSQSLPTAIADSPEAGLLFLAESAVSHADDLYELLPAARAGLLRRTRRLTDAASAYREALAEAASIALAASVRQPLSPPVAQSRTAIAVVRGCRGRAAACGPGGPGPASAAPSRSRTRPPWSGTHAGRWPGPMTVP